MKHGFALDDKSDSHFYFDDQQLLVFEKNDKNNIAYVHNIDEQHSEDPDHPLRGFKIGNGMGQIKHIVDTDYENYLIVEFCQDDVEAR